MTDPERAAFFTSTRALLTLIRALVISEVDCCCSVLAGISGHQLNGCVCCHTAVFTEQLHHTSPTVCVDVLKLTVVVVFVRLSQTHWLSR